MLLCQKNKYKEVTGNEYGPPPKKDKAATATDTKQESSEKNKAKNSEKARLKAEKEAKKAAQRAERERREKEKRDKLAGVGQENFGDAKLVQSHELTNKVWTKISDLKPNLAGKNVTVRGHIHTSRSVGKGAFVLIRSSLYSVQGVCFESDAVSNAMIKYIAALPSESVVDITGIVTVPDQPVDSATQKMVEMLPKKHKK